MSELNEKEQRQLDKLKRKHAAMEKRDQRYQERQAAATQFWHLFRTWGNTTNCSERTFNRVKKEVNRLVNEAQKGKIENIEERFQQAVDQAVVQTLPKKRQTYLKLSNKLCELVELNTTWSEATKRTKAEQDLMLRQLRILLLELEAGQIEDLAERFQQITTIRTETTTPEGEIS